MDEPEIVDVVKPLKYGTPGSLYILIPARLRERLKIDENTEFLLMIDNTGRLILKRKEAGG